MIVTAESNSVMVIIPDARERLDGLRENNNGFAFPVVAGKRYTITEVD